MLHQMYASYKELNAAHSNTSLPGAKIANNNKCIVDVDILTKSAEG